MTRSAREWSEFYKVTRNSPPRVTLVKALELFGAEPAVSSPLAFDLGCGAGSDVLALLEAGWNIVAVDNSSEALDHVRSRVPPECQSRCETVCTDIADAPLRSCRLVNASFSLPFCVPDRYHELWDRIANVIDPGGRFAGQFFGPDDTWARNGTVSWSTHDDVWSKLAEFDIEFFQVRNEDGETSLGEKKHWHVFSVVAQKRIT